MEQRLTVKFQKLLGTSIFPPGVFYEGKKFEQPDPETKAARGTLFALLTLAGPKELEAVVFGQAILDTLEDEYFAHLDSPPLACLEKSAFSAQRRLSDMALAAHLGQGVDFNLVLAVLWGRILYLCRLGSGAIYLLREGKVSEVVLGDEGSVACGSGFVYGGDGLILGSPDFKATFPAPTLAGVLDRLEEKMAAAEGARLCALVLKFQLEEIPGEAEAITFVKSDRSAAAKARRPNLKIVRSGFRAVAGVLGKIFSWRRLKGRRLVLSVRRRLALGLIVLAAVFALSVFWTIQKSRERRLKNSTVQVLERVELDLVSAQDLVGLNNIQAAEILNKGLNDLKKLEALGVSDPQIKASQHKVEELLGKVTKVEKITGLKLLYDFELSQKGIGAKATNLTGTETSLFLGDRETGAVWQLRLGPDLSARELGQGKLGRIVKLAAFGNRLAVLTHDDVTYFDLKEGQLQKDAVAGLEVKKVKDFTIYNGNLYFLLPEANQIQRSLSTEAGFGKPADWIKETANLSGAQELSVNGSAFVLLAKGQILKYEAGKNTDFGIEGFSDSVSPAVRLYSGPGLDFIYLLDPPALKVIKFTDSGAYQKTYDFGGTAVSRLDSLWVAPSRQKLYVLSGAKVYEADP